MRHLTQLLVLPMIMLSVCVAHAQHDDRFYFDSDSLEKWTKRFSDSLFKEFKGFSLPDMPTQPKLELLPQYKYPRYFEDPKLPGIPLPDMRNFPGPRNNAPAPRVYPRRKDGIDIPNFPGWRIEKLRNLT
jgi:hypothetical protein